jgi:hypothetical protein
MADKWFWLRVVLVHVTSAPAMIGYTHKTFRDFVGITR